MAETPKFRMLTPHDRYENKQKGGEETSRKRKWDDRDESFPGLSDVMKDHCRRYKKVEVGDDLTVPEPNHLVRSGTVTLHLCDDCGKAGRSLTPVQVPGMENKVGIVIPMCPGCSHMNAVCSRAQFYGTVVKSLVDKEAVRVADSK